MDKEELIEKIKSRSSIKDPTSAAFAGAGSKAAAIVNKTVMQYVQSPNPLSVLDFGAGSGRVAIPLVTLLKMGRFCCVDVDREAIEYLAGELGEKCEASVNGYLPPLQFEDKSFDFIYSISVWSHLPEDLSLAWLKEMKRIVKPGGVVLITFGGVVVLEQLKKRFPDQWGNVTTEQFNKEKFLYREYVNIQKNEKHYPGIAGKGSWGTALIHKDYLNSKWAELFEVLKFEPSGMNGRQDVVILRSRS